MTPYKFVSYAAKEKPDTEWTRLLEAYARGVDMARDEKDRIARIVSGNHGVYRLAGWVWTMWDCLPKFVVDIEGWGLEYRYAPDKTSLRRALKGCGRINAIIPVPPKRKK